MTNQPEWKLVAQIGDANPIDHGGQWIFEDTTGVYDPEVELWVPDSNEAYRYSIEKLAEVGDALVPADFVDRTDLPHPIEDYDQWFTDDLAGIASFVGQTREQLVTDLCSDDLVARARAYQSIGDYWGFVNLDEYPLTLTHREATKRYSQARFQLEVK